MQPITKILCCLKIATVSLLLAALSLSQTKSNVEGVVKDAETGDLLPGANVLFVGTGLGGTTDMNGRYTVRNVPEGTFTIRVSYIGYKTEEAAVQVKGDTKYEKDFSLEPEGIQGKTVVVSAQAEGQNQAINEQLSSEQIKNVVSAARIQELPDANAAESVGRLPGISVLRSGGEGDEVVVRGLAPKYNRITINGVEMAASDPNDRSVDLSMISSNMLEGIEVSKTVTPDMDADVIGGTVNFQLKEAKGSETGAPVFHFLTQGSYNGLSDAYNKLNNYKYVASGEQRFLNDNLGLFIQADLERKNLTSNELGGSYNHQGSSTVNYITNSLNLDDIPRDRQRANGTLVMDYKLPEGKIVLTNFFSTGTTNMQDREETYDIMNDLHTYSLDYTKSTLGVITNALEIEKQLPVFHVDAKLSHTYSETKDPNDWTISFQQTDQDLGQFSGAANLNPEDIPKAANNDTNNTFLHNLTNTDMFSKERALTASLDLETNINFSDEVTAILKFGGKYRYQTRLHTQDQYTGQGLDIESAPFVDSLIASHFPSTSQYIHTTHIPIKPFLDPNYKYGTFLAGDYPMILPLNFGMLSNMANFVKSNVALIQANNDAISYFHDAFNSTTNNYSGHENQSAGYVMATVNVGSQITIIPGVRYQDLQTTYTAPRGIENQSSATGGGYNYYDTTLTANHGFWLPDVTLRYKPLSWFDVRLSYTNTISYPDYDAIIPRIDVGFSGANGAPIAYNNYQLVPSTSKNYDAYFSFYDNSIGLFTVGGFLKQVDNLIYSWNFFVSNSAASPYYPPLLAHLAPSGLYNVTTFINDSSQAEDLGLELDWQTHFWYLPYPLNGLVFNVNYTHVYSHEQYSYVNAEKVGRATEYVDTSFTDRLLYQPNNIFNLSVGYDYEGFSIRVSMLYQADIFTGINFWPQLRTSTAAYTRWDLAAKQDLPWFGLQIYGNLNNINGESDVSLIQAATPVPESQQSYGLTAELGLRWQL
jgi:TonB-dependent receptor